jgi:RNA polymerase sigma factor (sigma-70 family)
MNPDDAGLQRFSAEEPLTETEAALVEQLRGGDVEAGRRFVRDHYPGIFRYLLSLAERRELAEDLTQETFLQAWRHLDRFEGRAPLRHWLYRIARREYLHALRGRRVQVSLEEISEFPAAGGREAIEGVELRDAIDRLPLAEREVVLLHYLEGYTSNEIAQIVRAPAGTVRRRLVTARDRLRGEFGEGDLVYLNEPLVPMRQWVWLPLDQVYALERRLSRGDAGDWEARRPETPREEDMERREFLRHAAAGAAGLMLPESEREVVDGRLLKKATLALKGTALADVCEQLRAETGVHLAASHGVADEKVTVFCQKTPLREVMRQLSRPFGYTWTRTTRDGQYRYELLQDLRSQLLEEELRYRDRNAAFLALEREMERYRPYLDLKPDEALARAKTAPPAEKPLLEKLAGFGWGPIQTYFRLSRQQQEALRAGRELTFSQEPRADEQPLPADIAHGVFQSFRGWHVVRHDGRVAFGPEQLVGSGVPPSASSDVRAEVSVTIQQSEPGQFTLGGHSGVFGTGGINSGMGEAPYAVGRSPVADRPDNRVANGKLASDPALCSHVTLLPEASCRAISPAGSTESAHEQVTTADVLETLHRATGFPIVADYYTRLYPPAEVSVLNAMLFEALNRIADATRMRWHKDGNWLQFRSVSYYDDRVKEVPNRLLQRWEAARKQHGMLTLDEMVEIAQLSDAQLNAAEMAEGVRICRGLTEWDLVRDNREHLRYLAAFTPEQRQAAMSAAGLPFIRMPLAQQQQFLSLALPPDAPPIRDLSELAGAVLRVEYTQPGGFQWGEPGLYHNWSRWVVPIERGRAGRRVIRPTVCGRTREAVLQELRRLDPRVVHAAVHSTLPGAASRSETDPALPLEAQIFPTDLRLTFIYIPSTQNAREIRISSGRMTNYQPSW